MIVVRVRCLHGACKLTAMCPCEFLRFGTHSDLSAVCPCEFLRSVRAMCPKNPYGLVHTPDDDL